MLLAGSTINSSNGVLRRAPTPCKRREDTTIQTGWGAHRLPSATATLASSRATAAEDHQREGP